jgi:hemerythrin-like metal-binding protein
MMEWTEDLAVGVEKIDSQHKELFIRINDLVAAIKQSVCKYKIGDVVKFLDDYVVFHFGEEEEYMQKYSYPEYPQHKAEHTKFLKNFNRLKKKLPELEGGKKPGSYDLSVEVNQVVVDWIIEHIKKKDKKFGSYLEANK